MTLFTRLNLYRPLTYMIVVLVLLFALNCLLVYVQGQSNEIARDTYPGQVSDPVEAIAKSYGWLVNTFLILNVLIAVAWYIWRGRNVEHFKEKHAAELAGAEAEIKGAEARVKSAEAEADGWKEMCERLRLELSDRGTKLAELGTLLSEEKAHGRQLEREVERFRKANLRLQELRETEEEV